MHLLPRRTMALGKLLLFRGTGAPHKPNSNNNKNNTSVSASSSATACSVALLLCAAGATLTLLAASTATLRARVAARYGGGGGFGGGGSGGGGGRGWFPAFPAAAKGAGEEAARVAAAAAAEAKAEAARVAAARAYRARCDPYARIGMLTMNGTWLPIPFDLPDAAAAASLPVPPSSSSNVSSSYSSSSSSASSSSAKPNITASTTAAGSRSSSSSSSSSTSSTSPGAPPGPTACPPSTTPPTNHHAAILAATPAGRAAAASSSSSAPARLPRHLRNKLVLIVGDSNDRNMNVYLCPRLNGTLSTVQLDGAREMPRDGKSFSSVCVVREAASPSASSSSSSSSSTSSSSGVPRAGVLVVATVFHYGVEVHPTRRNVAPMGRHAETGFPIDSKGRVAWVPAMLAGAAGALFPELCERDGVPGCVVAAKTRAAAEGKEADGVVVPTAAAAGKAAGKAGEERQGGGGGGLVAPAKVRRGEVYIRPGAPPGKAESEGEAPAGSSAGEDVDGSDVDADDDYDFDGGIAGMDYYPDDDQDVDVVSTSAQRRGPRPRGRRRRRRRSPEEGFSAYDHFNISAATAKVLPPAGYFPVPDLVIAQSLLWDLREWHGEQPAGVAWGEMVAQRGVLQGWADKYVRDMIVPLRRVVDEGAATAAGVAVDKGAEGGREQPRRRRVPIMVRTCPLTRIPHKLFPPHAVSAMNHAVRAIAARLSGEEAGGGGHGGGGVQDDGDNIEPILRGVLDWAKTMEGVDTLVQDGFHHTLEGYNAYSQMIMNELELLDWENKLFW
ncbi:hypothetical protein DFJ73DRAFT_798748 [Zopfochytrium polystomum]|nr:hypothetical protein DFJ73DRAFT_798748 [Zopfochytrium polystomum]